MSYITLFTIALMEPMLVLITCIRVVISFNFLHCTCTLPSMYVKQNKSFVAFHFLLDTYKSRKKKDISHHFGQLNSQSAVILESDQRLL